jgi:hypothetical protein
MEFRKARLGAAAVGLAGRRAPATPAAPPQNGSSNILLNSWFTLNKLYYGDNLDILRRYGKDDSVDLVYLDPPFKSNQNYNVLFQELDGTRSKAQMKAFKDTWVWDEEARRVYEETVEAGGAVARSCLPCTHFSALQTC